jgi:long-chain fatty acid transport protein
VTLSAVAAYEVSPSLIVGGGPTLTYADARLTKSIDFGSICLGALGSAGCAAAGVSPQSADGASDLTADAWGFGFTLGLLWRPVDGTRIGVSWRSQTDLRFSGEADFSVPAQASFLTAGGTFTDSGVSGGIVLPETTRLDIHQDIGRRWSVMAGLAWTAWSRFDELRFEFENPAQPTSVTPENWKDTFFFSAGATYRPDDRWAFRVGLAFDQSPVDDAFRTPVLPGEDRYWVSVGADYRIGDRVSVSASYLHVFLENASIDTLDPLGGRLVGSYEAAADVFALGLRVRF